MDKARAGKNLPKQRHQPQEKKDEKNLSGSMETAKCDYLLEDFLGY